jgi:hypothetical protein
LSRLGFVALVISNLLDALQALRHDWGYAQLAPSRVS